VLGFTEGWTLTGNLAIYASLSLCNKTLTIINHCFMTPLTNDVTQNLSANFNKEYLKVSECDHWGR
jgi:hypothetical protein